MRTLILAMAWNDLAGWLLLGVGGFFCFWALCWDRSRGRWRCPRCWYELEGARPADGVFPASGVTCSECGMLARSERSLRRTRRRWSSLLLVCLLALAATQCFRLPAIRSRGALAAIPTTVLMLIAEAEAYYTSLGPATMWPAPFTPTTGAGPAPLPPATTLEGEMWTRIKGAEGWYWQRAFYVHRVIRAQRVDTMIAIKTPERWVRGRGVPIQVDTYRFAQTTGATIIRPIGQSVVIGMDTMVVSGECVRDDELDLEYDLIGPMGRLCRLRSRCPIAVADEDTPLLIPVSDPALSKIVRETLGLRLIADDEGRVRLLMNPAFDPNIWQKLGFGVAGRLILRDGEEVLGRAELVASAFSPTHDQQRTLSVEWVSGAAERAGARMNSITIEMHGDPAMAEDLFLTQAALLVPARAWAGSFVIDPNEP